MTNNWNSFGICLEYFQRTFFHFAANHSESLIWKPARKNWPETFFCVAPPHSGRFGMIFSKKYDSNPIIL